MLSRKTRATASVFSCSTAVGSSQPPAALRDGRPRGMKAVKPPVSCWSWRTASRKATRCSCALPEPIANAAEFVRTSLARAEVHCCNGLHSQPVRRAMHRKPLGCAALWLRDAIPEVGCVEARRVVAGDGIQPGAAEARDGLAQVQPAGRGQSHNLRRREGLDPEGRKALADAAQIPSNHAMPQSFHWEPSAPTPLTRRTPVLPSSTVSPISTNRRCAQPMSAVIRIVCAAVHCRCTVDVAGDGVADHALGMQSAAHGVGLHANADQVVAAKAVQGLFAADSHGPILRAQMPPHRSRARSASAAPAAGQSQRAGRWPR